MNNGSNADLSEAEVEFTVSDTDVARIEDGKLIGLKDGVATLSVKITSDGSDVQSNSINIKVGNGSEEVPPIEGEVNKDGLQAVVDRAAGLLKDNYTEESWAKLEAAIESLQLKETDVFKTHLEIAIEEALKVTEDELSRVVPVVLEEFRAAVAEAQAILNNSSATQAQVDKSFTRLSNVMQMLAFQKGDKTNLISLVERINALEQEIKSSYETLLRAFLELRLKPNKDLLQGLINKAQSLDSSKYTVESFMMVEKALEEAEEVFADEDASENKINKAAEKLSKAIDELVEADTSDDSENNDSGNNGSDNNGTENEGSGNNETGNNGSQNNGSSNNASSSESGKGESKLPQTGGTSAAAVGLFGSIMAIVGSTLFKKKK